MERVKPSELTTAARVADALVYAAGVAGVVAGGLLFRQGETGFAAVAWCLTFIAGAGLRLASAATRALAQLLIRTEELADDIAALRRAQPPASAADPPTTPDPYRRWGDRWH